jgi:hypothetical protein
VTRKIVSTEKLQSANITVSVDGKTQTYELRDISFDQKRDEAGRNIGRTIIDFIYNATEGKARAKN